MNISQLTSSTSTNANASGTQASTQTSAQATSSASPLSLAMQKAGARLQSQLDTTSAQLSSFGKLKSSVSDAQLAAKTLGGLTATSSAADVRTAAGRFLTSFNAAVTTAKATASVAGGSAAEASGANRVTADLNRTLRSNTANMDALRKIGIKQLP